MLAKLDFQSLVEQTVTSKRMPRAMDLYLGFPRLNPLRFIARDPILTGGCFSTACLAHFLLESVSGSGLKSKN